MNEISKQQLIEDFLYPIWMGSSDWVRKDWSVFQNNLRDALSKRTLAQFYAHVSRRCNVTIPYKYLLERIEPILNSEQDERILKMLNDDLEVMIISLNIYNQNIIQERKKIKYESAE